MLQTHTCQVRCTPVSSGESRRAQATHPVKVRPRPLATLQPPPRRTSPNTVLPRPTIAKNTQRGSAQRQTPTAPKRPAHRENHREPPSCLNYQQRRSMRMAHDGKMPNPRVRLITVCPRLRIAQHSRTHGVRLPSRHIKFVRRKKQNDGQR